MFRISRRQKPKQTSLRFRKKKLLRDNLSTVNFRFFVFLFSLHNFVRITGPYFVPLSVLSVIILFYSSNLSVVVIVIVTVFVFIFILR